MSAAPKPTAKKTRKLTDAELSARFREGCPHCGSPLTARVAMAEDEHTGKQRFAGQFFGCSKFGRGCTAHYSVNLKGIEANWQVAADEAAA